MSVDLRWGCCIDVMRTMPDNSVDSIVTDPPYELGFMGKAWDATGIANNVTMWREALRVLKPGGHLLSFSGSRTYHRMTCAIEDAGFEVRDQIMWVYGSGFPKSLDVSKAIDKARTEDVEPTRVVCRAIRAAMNAAGMRSRDLVHLFGGCHPRLIDHWGARDTDSQPSLPTWDQWLILRAALPIGGTHDSEVWRLNGRKGQAGEAWQTAEVVGVAEGVMSGWSMDGGTKFVDRDIKSANSDAARQWEGWGTALKPAHEPICVARKPLIGTVAANVLQHGTGAINIDACRVAGESTIREVKADANSRENWRMGAQDGAHGSKDGRWPANLIHDGSVPFPDAGGQQGALTGDEPSARAGAIDQNCYGTMDRRHACQPRSEIDKSAARFFYCAKASKSDRGDGNTHPTVKPTALMAYLCRLVTPPGGLVLDPFMGSGSTGKAAKREGFRFIGIDLTPEYVIIAATRIGAES